jgi:hypothetical protein
MIAKQCLSVTGLFAMVALSNDAISVWDVVQDGEADKIARFATSSDNSVFVCSLTFSSWADRLSGKPPVVRHVQWHGMHFFSRVDALRLSDGALATTAEVFTGGTSFDFSVVAEDKPHAQATVKWIQCSISGDMDRKVTNLREPSLVLDGDHALIVASAAMTEVHRGRPFAWIGDPATVDERGMISARWIGPGGDPRVARLGGVHFVVVRDDTGTSPGHVLMYVSDDLRTWTPGPPAAPEFKYWSYDCIAQDASLWLFGVRKEGMQYLGDAWKFDTSTRTWIRALSPIALDEAEARRVCLMRAPGMPAIITRNGDGEFVRR